jgi:hypothetical protein
MSIFGMLLGGKAQLCEETWEPFSHVEDKEDYCAAEWADIITRAKRYGRASTVHDQGLEALLWKVRGDIQGLQRWGQDGRAVSRGDCLARLSGPASRFVWVAGTGKGLELVLREQKMIIHHSSRNEELEQIKSIFLTGWGMVKAALYTLLYAIVTLLLVIVHIATFSVNIVIGVLTMLYGLICMARLLLVQCQELAALGPQASMIGPRWL